MNDDIPKNPDDTLAETEPTHDDTPAPAQEVLAVSKPEPAIPATPVTPRPADERPIIVMRPRSQIWMAMAITICVVTLSGLAFALYFFPSARVLQQDTTAAVQRGGEAASTVYNDLKSGAKELVALSKPKVEISTVIESALGEIRSQGKLVVLTRTFPVRAERSTVTKLWDYIPLDDSAVEIKVSNNAVQYHIPLHGVSARNFTHDEAANTLVVTLPEPRVDQEMIAISSNPDDWQVKKDIAWLHIQHARPDWSGKTLETEARAQLRGLLIQQAEEPLVMKEAREMGYGIVAGLLKAAVAPYAQDLNIEVRFDATLDTGTELETWPNNAPLS